jgi:hypothetical protein
VREEVRAVGPEGGRVALDIEPRLRATFPKNAVKKKIKVNYSILLTLQEPVCN